VSDWEQVKEANTRQAIKAVSKALERSVAVGFTFLKGHRKALFNFFSGKFQWFLKEKIISVCYVTEIEMFNILRSGWGPEPKLYWIFPRIHYMQRFDCFLGTEQS